MGSAHENVIIPAETLTLEDSFLGLVNKDHGLTSKTAKPHRTQFAG
jgi:hypothetical protein